MCGGAEGEGGRNFMLSAEPVAGLDFTSLRSQPEQNQESVAQLTVPPKCPINGYFKAKSGA